MNNILVAVVVFLCFESKGRREERENSDGKRSDLGENIFWLFS